MKRRRRRNRAEHPGIMAQGWARIPAAEPSSPAPRCGSRSLVAAESAEPESRTMTDLAHAAVLVRRPARLDAGADSSARAARIAQPRQGSRRSMRRGARPAADRLRRPRRPDSGGDARRSPARRVRQATGPQMLLLGHFDTVWAVGQIDRMPLREEAGRLHGPGIFDMKAGIGDRHARHPGAPTGSGSQPPHVVMLWTTDEEVGSGTSRAADRGRGAAEPRGAGARAVAARRRREDRRARAAASSSCSSTASPRTPASIPARGPARSTSWPGRSSLVEQLQDPAARHHRQRRRDLRRLPRERDRGRGACADRRPRADARRRRAGGAALRALRPATPRTTLRSRAASIGRRSNATGGVVRLYEMARAVARELGRDLPEGAAGGGSDGNFTAALGVPTLDGLGPRATAPTRCTSTSCSRTFPSARRCWQECSAASRWTYR